MPSDTSAMTLKILVAASTSWLAKKLCHPAVTREVREMFVLHVVCINVCMTTMMRSTCTLHPASNFMHTHAYTHLHSDKYCLNFIRICADDPKYDVWEARKLRSLFPLFEKEKKKIIYIIYLGSKYVVVKSTGVARFESQLKTKWFWDRTTHLRIQLCIWLKLIHVINISSYRSLLLFLWSRVWETLLRSLPAFLDLGLLDLQAWA